MSTEEEIEPRDEPKNAAANASAPISSHRDLARDVARRYWDWSRARTGHAPPETYMAIAKIVEAALKAGFPERDIKAALVAIDRAPTRPAITRQTLWREIDRAAGVRVRPTSTNDWVAGVEAINAEQRTEPAA